MNFALMLEKPQRRSRANFGTVHYRSNVLDPEVHGEVTEFDNGTAEREHVLSTSATEGF